MPMKRSGRSVDDANRVIEIDEVFVARMASDLSNSHTSEKILRLTSSFSVAVSITRSQSESPSCNRRLDARERALAIVFADRFLADLAGHVAVDRRHSGLDTIGRQVVKQNRIPSQRAHMGNTVTHLAGADYSDSLNFYRHIFVRSMRIPGSLLRFRLGFASSR